MSEKFDDLVDETLEVERDLRALIPGRPSLRCFIAECLNRADASYDAVEEVKQRLADPAFAIKSGCATFIRDLTRQIANGRFPEPPAKGRINALYFNQKPEVVMELGGQASSPFLLWIIAAELAYQGTPEVFGNVEDLAAHKAKLAELEARRKDLYARFPTSWGHNDLHIGRITSDGAALITFAKAPGGVPVHPPETAAGRLVEYLMRQEREAEAKAA